MGHDLSCAYVTDRGFLPCTCFSIATLVASAKKPPRIFLLHTGLTSQDVAQADAYLQSVGASVSFIAMPESDLSGLRRPTSLPKATYGRLLMHRFLPDDLERVLYIDGDTLVDIDVGLLSAQSLSGKTLGAVVDIGRILVGRREEAQQRLGLGSTGDYFNAGVLLIDWAKWRSEKLGELCIQALLDTPERFTQNDQCALNHICSGTWTKLSAKWNYQPANVLYGAQTSVIFHFLGGRKPWKGDHLRHPMRFVRRYAALYSGSPWAAEFRRPAWPFSVSEGLRIAKNTMTPRFWSRAAAYRSTDLE